MTIAVSSLSNRLKVQVKVVTFCTVPAEVGRPAFPPHPNSKINLKKWRIFRRSIWWCFRPHFHHQSTTIYHALHHVLRTANRKTPCKNTTSPCRKKLQNIP